jgi:hypothetical protein
MFDLVSLILHFGNKESGLKRGVNWYVEQGYKSLRYSSRGNFLQVYEFIRVRDSYVVKGKVVRWDEMVCTGSIWLRIGTNGGLS